MRGDAELWCGLPLARLVGAAVIVDRHPASLAGRSWSRRFMNAETEAGQHPAVCTVRSCPGDRAKGLA